LALATINKVAECGSVWKEQLKELIDKAYPLKDKKEDDLEVFADDSEFRAVVWLLPLRACSGWPSHPTKWRVTKKLAKDQWKSRADV